MDINTQLGSNSLYYNAKFTLKLTPTETMA
jgi:hypothetical protein